MSRSVSPGETAARGALAYQGRASYHFLKSLYLPAMALAKPPTFLTAAE